MKWYFVPIAMVLIILIITAILGGFAGLYRYVDCPSKPTGNITTAQFFSCPAQVDDKLSYGFFSIIVGVVGVTSVLYYTHREKKETNN